METETLKDEFFKLNKTSYPNDFLLQYQNIGISPVTIFQSALVLPFHMPYKEGTCITMKLDKDNVITLVFYHIETSEKLYSGIIQSEPREVKIQRTVVEFNWASQNNHFKSDDKEIKNDLLTYIFDTFLEKLNSVITSYIITTKDFTVYKLSNEMLEFATMFRTIDTKDWSYKSGIFLFHPYVPYIKEEISLELTNVIGRNALIINNELNPFILSQALILNARRNFISGFYKESILYSQTAFEIFLRTLTSEFYKEESRTEKDLEQVFNKGFMVVLKKEFQIRIDGNWNVKNETVAIGEWYKNCYLNRNRIIHGGFEPDNYITKQAIQSTEKAVRYIITLLHVKKDKYQNILKYLTEIKLL